MKTIFGSHENMKKALGVGDDDIIKEPTTMSAGGGRTWPLKTNWASVTLPSGKVIKVYDPGSDANGWRTLEDLRNV